ncbi:transglycosylase domain-containing protein [Paenibacillus antarcticus]|uniref:Penicillin-binding protein n=1 Tax=Paenibacillus antarcticus TaxID=253703 RepID=A0A168PRC6_9BACL|nr:PBP1A family penicillin-binding protein [Paenibacillus antarcticus]OAB46997.1 penicillin-binding protein [Paenibacillus antarcticus]
MANNRPTRANANTEPPKKKKKKRKLSKKRLFWTLFFTAAVAIFCALAGYLFITVNGERLYNENKDKMIVAENSKVYDRNGKLMGQLSIQKSEPVDSDQIPDLLKNAFIATEDKRFMEHGGVDIWSIGRAAVKDIIARAKVEGGSTITQQLAKNIFLTREKTFFRKATEVSIAMALENNNTKDEIITMYLNRINFGGQIYGIKAASQYYFGVNDLNNLKVWQMATLAAMPKGPTKYNPLRNPENSKERRAIVLQLMQEQGYITAEERETAKNVVYDYTPPAKKQQYLAFMDYVMSEAEEVTGLSQDDLNVGGYKIYTTMDANAQQVIEKEFADDSNFEKSADDVQVQASMVIMNNDTGAIVALMGGRDYERKGYSRVTSSRRQPGSALKPIASYAPALESGQYTKDSLLSNKKQCFSNYCPGNLHGYSDTISMPDAIQKSENIPAVWLLNEIGVNTGFKFAEKMGISLDKEDKNLSLALGGMSKGTNTLEMTQAYSAFANGGTLNEAYSIKQIKDSDDKVKYEHKKDGVEVMSKDTSVQMTQMMKNVVDSGTGKKAAISRPVAGKTGTTQSGIKGNNSNRDVWFVGYTPELTAAVWMGYDKPDKTHLLHKSSSLAATFWGKVMEQAIQGFEAKSFPESETVKPPVEVPVVPDIVDVVTGLSGAYDPNTQIVSLNWNGVEGNNVQYHVYRKESSESEFRLIKDAATASNIEDFDIVEGFTYEYYVTAFFADTNTESEKSNFVQVFTEPLEPEIEPEPDVEQPDINNGNGNGNGNGNNGSGNGNGNGNGNNGNGNNGNTGGGTIPGVPETNPGTGGESIPPDGTTVPPEQVVPPVGEDSGVTSPEDPGSVNTGTTENNVESQGTTTP